MHSRQRAYAVATCAIVALFLLSAGQARAAGLLAMYSFNGTLNDASGHGRTAKDSGKPAYVAGAPFGGKAISFDGSGKAVVTAPLNISYQHLPQLTMGAWVRTHAIDNPQYGIISNDDGDYDRSLDIDNRAGGTVDWSAFVGGSIAGKVAAVNGKWIFVAVSFDNTASGTGNYAFYVNDGTTTTTLTGTDTFDSDSVTTGVTIGRNPNFDQPFKGEIANAFFYDGVLTKAQIEAIVARGPAAIPGYHKPK